MNKNHINFREKVLAFKQINLKSIKSLMFLLYLLGIIILFNGCAAKYTVISGTDLVTPVSVSPVVSTNGKVEDNKISKFQAEANYSYSKWIFLYYRKHKRNSFSNIQNNIIKATKGSDQFSVNNLEFKIENKQLIIYYLLGGHINKNVITNVNGNIIRVK